MLRHRRLARSARSAPCLGAPLCSPRSACVARTLETQPGQQWKRTAAHTQPGPASRREAGPHLAPRSARRSDTLTLLRALRVARAFQTQPGQQRQRTAGSLQRTRSQVRHRGARKAPTSLRAPRVARTLNRTPSPRSALRASLGTHAWGASLTSLRAPRVARNARVGRWRAKAAALRGNLMAPEAMRGNLMAPERLLRGAGLVEGQLDGARAIASRRSRARGKGAKVPRRRVEHPREKSNPLKVSCTARGLAEGSQMVLSGYLPADGCGEFALLRSRPHAVPPSSTTPTHSFENTPVSTVISGKTRHLHQG